MNTVQAAWEDFERQCMPPNAGAVQRNETRLAFYAGAMSMFTTMTGPVAALSEDAGCAVLSGFADEFMRHGAELAARAMHQSRSR